MLTSKKFQRPLNNRDQRVSNEFNSIYYPPSSQICQRLTRIEQCKNPHDPNQMHVHKQNTEQEFNQLIDNIDQALNEGSIVNDKFKGFRSVTTKPIVSLKLRPSFQQSDYPLDDCQRVKVYQDKHFQIKNYYNYLFQIAQKKQLSNICTQNQRLEKLFKLQKESLQNSKSVHIKKDEKNEVIQNQSMLQTSLKNEKPILDPKHISWPQGKNLSFNPKQKDRLKKSKNW